MTGLPWVKLAADLTWYLGIIQKPLVRLANPKAVIIPKERDIVDIWTFAHALMGSLFTAFALPFLTWKWAWLFGTLVMFLYETYIDGNLLEDPRGASVRDLGANLFGSILVSVGYAAGLLVTALFS